MLHYVSLKIGMMAKVLCLSLTLIAGCVSLNDAKQEDKTDKVIEAKLGIVMNYLDVGQIDKAYAEARRLNKEFPSDARVVNMMGLCHLSQRQPAIAAKLFRKAIDLKDDIAYQLNLSSAQIDLHKYGAAMCFLTANL